MRIIECDRCHKRIKGVSKTGYINLDLRDIGSGELEGNHEFDEWDLCDDCLMQIRDFVHMVPLTLKVDEQLVASEEPAQVDVDESHGLAARPKRPKAGSHPKAELMKEMARSGASLTEIMEVAGCSEPTARKYMKEVTE